MDTWKEREMKKCNLRCIEFNKGRKTKFENRERDGDRYIDRERVGESEREREWMILSERELMMEHEAD